LINTYWKNSYIKNGKRIFLDPNNRAIKENIRLFRICIFKYLKLEIMNTNQTQSRYYGGIFLISMATLLLELSLTRVMSVSLWYHFGFLVISTALLGFGTAGVVLAVWKNLREKYDLNRTLATLAILFGIITILSFWVLHQIPFDPFSLAVDKRQIYFLPLYYIVVSAPFFISGLFISLLFTRMPERMSRLYAYDLIGAALGCLLVALVMPVFGGSGSVTVAAALGTMAALFFTNKKSIKFISLFLIITFAGLSFFANDLLPITINVNKRPPKSPIAKMKPIYTAWNTFSYIELFDVKADPSKKIEPSRRFFLFDAGTAATGMVDLSGGVQHYLHEHPQDSLYWTYPALMHTKNPAVLIIGSGGGNQVLDALHAKAKKVVCIEINPIINKVVKDKMNDYWGGLFHQPGVELITEEGRSYINKTKEKFDAILSVHTISNAAIASGALSLAENYVLTKEAFETYHDHLNENGILYLSRPEFQLPRVFTTMQEVLAERGINDSRNYFYAFRQPPGSGVGGRSEKAFYSVFLFKKSGFTKDEIAHIDSFIENKQVLVDSVPKNLELLYSPFSAHPHNIFDTIVTTKDKEALYRSVPFEIAPATDDRPFFNQRVRWSSIGIKHFTEVFSEKNARAALEDQPIAEITLLMILFQSIIIAAILIILPLLRYARQGLKFTNRWKYLAYFACLGIGFIMIEIAFIQRFTLYLGQPVYTLAVIIAGLLLFTGIGSYLTDKLNISTANLKVRYLPLLLGVLVVTSLLTPLIFQATIHWNLFIRIVVSLLMLAPLGTLLGMPFPTGIKAVSTESNSFIPWAWGVNGFFTVIGSVGALILGMALGFKIVILLAALSYLFALLIVPRK
jgi:spermidine synthase